MTFSPFMADHVAKDATRLRWIPHDQNASGRATGECMEDRRHARTNDWRKPAD
jgi:hypothetical protein